MSLKVEQLLEEMLQDIRTNGGIAYEDIPSIDLYMDQLTTFMEEQLRSSARDPKNNKILTKTMINNYAKNELLPPPIRKKYSKDHIILLIFIYYLKSVLSINDIATLLGPIKQDCFHISDTQPLHLSNIYRVLLGLIDEQQEEFESDLIKKAELAQGAFSELKNKTGDDMRTFLYLSLLAYDVHLKKRLIEKTLDHINDKKKGSKKGKSKK